LRQKLKKYFAETGDNENFYVAQVEKYRLNPVEKDKTAKKEVGKYKKKKDSESED